MVTSFEVQLNKSFHLTKPLVTDLAGAKSAPNDFAGEANVYVRKKSFLQPGSGMEALNKNLKLATTVDTAAVRSFYDAVGYECELSSGDRLLVGSVQNEIIAAVRLCREEGILVLRGMYVAEWCRRRGIGAQLLRFVSSEIGSSECWCVPYDYLAKFYSSIGFRVCEGGMVPPFLADRQVRYTQEGRAVTVMHRPAE